MKSTKKPDMRCLHCGEADMVPRWENHRYTLPKGWGVNLEHVQVMHCPKCKEWEVSIPGIEKLHRTIAAALARKQAKLAPAEVAFLRTHLDVTAKVLAEQLGVTPEALSRWENGKRVIDPTVDRLLRLLVLVHDHGADTFDTGVLASIDEAGTPMRLTIRMGTNGEWKAAA